MDAELTERLARARGAVHELDALRRRLETLDITIGQRGEDLARLDETLRREEKDVARLEGLGLTAMFASMLGTKESRLSKERAEALKAKLARDACADALEACRQDRDDLQLRIDEAGDPAAELAQALADKEMALRGESSVLDAKLDSIDAAHADACSVIDEIGQAVHAADDAIDALEGVAGSLNSAENWGTFDMLGGGMIATWAKHSKIDAARSQAHAAQRALDRFAREVKDVPGQRGETLVVEIGEFLKFADFLFDGLIADWCVQRRIGDSRRNVSTTIKRVTGLRDRLVERDTAIRAEIESLAQERRTLVDSA